MTKRNFRIFLVTTSKLQDEIFWITPNKLFLIICNRMKAKWKHCSSKAPLSPKILLYFRFPRLRPVVFTKCNRGIWRMIRSREDWSVWRRICIKVTFILTFWHPRLNLDLRGDKPDTNCQSTWSINISAVTHKAESAPELGRAVDERCMGIKGVRMMRIRIQ
jgi:hypothetical protein